MEFTKSFAEILQGNTGAKTATKRANDFKSEMDTYYHEGQKEGTSIHLNGLHNHLRWRDGFLYGVTGYPASGKSTFLNWLFILRVINEGKKIAIYSPESYPIPDMIEELARQLSGGSISKGFGNQLSEIEYEKAMEIINDHFYFLDFEDIPSIQDVFAEFSRLVKSEGVGTVLIDPFNSVSEGAGGGTGNVSQFLKVALTQAKLFAVNHNIPVILVEHPRSAGTDGAEKRPEPSPFMVYGGSMWWNKVDVFFTVDRDMFDSQNPEVIIKVWKVKKQRLMGTPSSDLVIYFDKTTGQYNSTY